MPRMTGDQFLAQMLQAQGVSHVFYVPAILPTTLQHLRRVGVQPIAAHGEKAAAYMADGYARVTGRPGICLAQTVGASNLAAGLKDAFMSCSPVIALTGGPAFESSYRHVYQEIRDLQMFDAVTKWNAVVETPDRLGDIVRQAFRVATTGAPGPVHVELRGHHGQLAELSADFDLVFEPRFCRVPPFRPEPGPELVTEAIRLLTAARRPVLVAGGGVIWSGAEAELVELAEKLSIPVATSLNAKAAIADDHPLCVGVPGRYSRSCANKLIAEADLVFFVGSHTGSLVTHDWRVPAVGTPIVQIDIDPEELGRHYPAAAPLNGDAKATLRRMLDATAPRSNAIWTGRARELVREWRREVEPVLRSSATPIRPERLVAEIASVLPDDAVVVVDTLQASAWAGTMLGLKGRSQRFVRCGGSLGWALPAALGAKCGVGRRPVVCFTGDGGFYYHLAELETAARYGINAVIVVNNNGAYACEAPTWETLYGDKRHPDMRASWEFGSLDLAGIAAKMGCAAATVSRPEQIADALGRALAGDRPTVVDVVTDPDALYAKAWLPALGTGAAG